MTGPLLPGATLGILGGGQLGKMIAVEARRQGYRVAIMDPDPACSARPFADEYVQGAFGDAAAAEELAKRADVVTLETEHIPSPVIEAAERHRVVRPSSRELYVIQDRLRQKTFLRERGFPQPDFRAVDDAASLGRAIAEIGVPSLLKTRTGGYDGKGQARVTALDGAVPAWESIGAKPAVLEQFVRFEREVSVVLARDLRGNVAYYALAENVHRRGILHTTRAPAAVPDEVQRRAQKLATDIAVALDHVGVMAVEMFLMPDGKLLVNEIAPRVHNSGHYTLGACATSQFEQHLRAVVGLPLGDATALTPSVMLNLLGDLWANGTPDWRLVLEEPTAKLHLYGKTKAPPGRKMGHVTVLAPTADEAMATAERLYAELEKRAQRGA